MCHKTRVRDNNLMQGTFHIFQEHLFGSGLDGSSMGNSCATSNHSRSKSDSVFLSKVIDLI